MKVHGKLLLTGILSVTVGSVACYSAMAQDQAGAEQTQPLWPAAITDNIATEHGGVESWGDIEAGGRYFIQRPKDGGTPWLTPSIQRPDKQSIAKFEEYGAVREGAYLERLNVGGQTKDAEYFVDLRATDVSNNNQRYVFDWAKTGEISGTVSWDQIPHLYSTSAQSIWSGANNLTTNVQLGVLAGNGYGSSNTFNGAGLVGGGYNNALNVGNTPAGAANPGFPLYSTSPKAATFPAGVTVSGLVNSALQGNLRTVQIGIDRDKFETDTRWTPSANWEIRGGYSTEHREGTQLAGVVWGGPGGPERADVPRPIDDTTQQGKLSVERTGKWAYGNWNVKLTGAISDFNNSVPSFTIENPFAQIVGPNIGCASSFITPSAPCARMSNMPSNQAYTANITAGIDLPYHSRWMNTVQYQSLQQDEQFMPMTISTGTLYSANTNPLPATGVYAACGGTIPGALCLTPFPGQNQAVAGSLRTALPATSLSGDVEILTVNSVLTTQLTHDLKSTLRYRFYDNDNQTPRRSWAWASEDYTNSTDFRTNFGYSRSQQNASEDLTYHILRNASVGGSVGWEQINRDKREALTTDEYIGKVYTDVRIDDFGMFRGSYQYSERRNDRYDAAAWYATTYPLLTGTNGYANGALANNWAMRKFDLADRDRDKANMWFSFDNIPFIPNLTITPNAGLRYDHYLTDTSTPIVTPSGQTMYGAGLLKDNNWNAGVEAAYVFRPGTSIMAAYVRENYLKTLVGTPTAANSITGAGFAAPMSRFSSDMKEDVDTVIVGANVALNDNWDFRASYSIAFGKENWTAQGYGAQSDCYAAAAVAGGVSNPAANNCQAIPTVDTNAQRVDALLRYKFDSEFVNKAGFSGDVYWNLKYSWDHLRINNWQNDLNTPYMYLVDAANNGRNISMSGINPNYDVHVVASSINFKW
jgi:MtrB/PioB family decaheme-associated outer membrane protein